MDRVIEKKTWTTKRLLTIGGIVAIVALIGSSYYFTSGKSKLNQDTDRLTISEIKKGPYKDNIPVNGVVLPLTSIYLDATEGGRVEEKYVEDGAVMKKGEPILRLSNTDLMMTMMSSQNSVYNTLTQMQINQTNAS
ncbi:MAG TPA: efflux RND transporter periplasmic adaptor subunit, partial [Chitinophagaceae bacterium]|nr:efflux RND transporter periplasmic adaptor subunit [Chitinophagaceae bacterium]